MKVAVAGVGDLAKYFIEELQASNHQVITLSRTIKASLDKSIKQHTTDYSPSSVEAILQDCDALVCAIRSGIPEFASIHRTLLEACRRSPRCKRLIPSFWAGNFEEFPDEPVIWSQEVQPVFKALDGQSHVAWTAICPGWLADYILPSTQRHLSDVGDMWPQNQQDKTFRLNGDGSEMVNVTSARDTARALVFILERDSSEWERYTYISGQQLTWRELAEFIKSRDPEYEIQQRPPASGVQQLVMTENPDSRAAAIFNTWAHSEALHFPWHKVESHREKYFKAIKFRSLEELANEAAANPDKVV